MQVKESTAKETKSEQLVRGFLFACTNKSEAECLKGLLFATEKSYGPVVIRIRPGDLLFLNNIESNVLHGVFRATSDGGFNIKPCAFDGKYPYQVEVEPLGEITSLPNAKRLLSKYTIKRNTPVFGSKLADLMSQFLSGSKQLDLVNMAQDSTSKNALSREMERVRTNTAKLDIEEEIPPIEATTFWDFLRQSYGLTPKGNNKYAGVTPALIIYNMVWRYTDPGDLVVDPMCGSGTTIDVCTEEKRRVIGYDISSTREEIIQNDARKIPLDDNSVDMVFIDSPYGDNITYSQHPDDIGHISSESEEFYDELEKVMAECKRILKDERVLGWLIGDQWVRGKFTPVGLLIYERLCKHFEPVDIICVSRRGQYSHTGMWYNRARRFNFYLRGFKYLVIVRKRLNKAPSRKTRKVEWAHYKRGG